MFMKLKKYCQSSMYDNIRYYSIDTYYIVKNIKHNQNSRNRSYNIYFIYFLKIAE